MELVHQLFFVYVSKASFIYDFTSADKNGEVIVPLESSFICFLRL